MRTLLLSGSFVVAGAMGWLNAVPALGADSAGSVSPLGDPAGRMIESCLTLAAEKKWPPLSVAVVDESGALIRFIRQTGASAVTADAAVLKARSAARLRAPTTALNPHDLAVRDIFLLLQLTDVPGGVPFQSQDGFARGAIGVSGAESSQDTECAQEAAGASQ